MVDVVDGAVESDKLLELGTEGVAADAVIWTRTRRPLHGLAPERRNQGLGFYRGYYGSQFGVWEKWYYVGNTGFAETGAAVPWGNVAATKKFKAICTITLTCFGNWY